MVEINKESIILIEALKEIKVNNDAPGN